jgi:hypothetical protein
MVTKIRAVIVRKTRMALPFKLWFSISEISQFQ